VKIKCDDDIVRHFSVCKFNETYCHYNESECLECGVLFGVHDTKMLKPKWRKHSCGVSKEESK